MAEENAIENKDKNKGGSKTSLYLAALVPIILMLAGFFIVTKFINPRYGAIGSGTGSGEVSDGENGKQNSESKKNKKHGKEEKTIVELGSVLANPLGTEGRRFVKVGVCLELNSKEFTEQVEAEKSKLQHQLILILSSKDVEALTSPTGKSELLAEIKEAMISQLDLTDEDITNVYFTEFIVQ